MKNWSSTYTQLIIEDQKKMKQEIEVIKENNEYLKWSLEYQKQYSRRNNVLNSIGGVSHVKGGVLFKTVERICAAFK